MATTGANSPPVVATSIRESWERWSGWIRLLGGSLGVYSPNNVIKPLERTSVKGLKRRLREFEERSTVLPGNSVMLAGGWTLGGILVNIGETTDKGDAGELRVRTT